MNTNKSAIRPDPQQNLAQQVKKWVEEQGYSLEMRVAKKFRENDFTVSQFEHFIDQESQSVRPVDVVASLLKVIDTSQISIKLFIECKYSAKDRPWVIVVTSDKFDKFAFFSRILKGEHPANWKNISSLQGRIIGSIAQSIDSETGLDSFRVKNPGYIVAESFRNHDDHAYEAIIQISKSVESHDIEAENEYLKLAQETDTNEGKFSGLFFSIAFPIVVINGNLFESYLDEEGEIVISEVKSGTVFVPYRRVEKNPNAQVTLSPVTIVTEKHLEEFIATTKANFSTMLQQTKAIENVINFEKSKYGVSISDDIAF